MYVISSVGFAIPGAKLSMVIASLNLELITGVTGAEMTRLYGPPLPVQVLLSVAVTTIGKMPDCVGVPLNTPTVDKVIPVGNVLAVVNV